MAQSVLLRADLTDFTMATPLVMLLAVGTFDDSGQVAWVGAPDQRGWQV